MALPMLINGADCGPSNPLQGLSKRFDQDRGLQQDYFGAGRAGSSKENFRSQAGPSTQDIDAAARFFSPNHAAPQLAGPSAYDLSALHRSLPHAEAQHQQQGPLAGWAADFLQQQPIQSPQAANASVDQLQRDVMSPNFAQLGANVQPTGMMPWNHHPMVHQMHPNLSYGAQIPIHGNASTMPHTQISWDKEFASQEMHLASPVSGILREEPQQASASQNPQGDADELARTAGLLLETVRDEQNPKFQNSMFMGLMKQLRDREVVVEGDQIVDNDRTSEITADAKGKQRAVDPSNSFASSTRAHLLNAEQREDELVNGLFTDFLASGMPQGHKAFRAQQQGLDTVQSEDDAYWQKENADYVQYWNDARTARPVGQQGDPTWDKLQADWDRFEATTAGVKPVTTYHFQQNNPYLLGESSKTRNHLLHDDRQAFLENVLEIEAMVQRNPTDASAWFELGVKQQENEREKKAVEALERAAELDPTHLPTWLALAISYTNDSNRSGTFESIREWINRNETYKSAVQGYLAQFPDNPSASGTERFNHLVQCLITMARIDMSGEIDADIQIALAVLFNTNEDYEKAQDCFRTALAVRPNDWLLYNRVGATMANSGHATEALQYYERALELNPMYIRARYNLGISCINLRRYDEAARHIFHALLLQDADSVWDDGAGTSDNNRGVTSSALWESLKTTCLHMHRVDLASVCDQHDLEGFRNNFEV